MPASKPASKSASKKPKERSLAARADRYDLYQRSVQAPAEDVRLLGRIFRTRRGREALTLREDFCGTAQLSLHWARSRPARRAVGVDLDPAVLAWGREHNLAAAPPAVRRRVELVQADVRSVRAPRVDLALAPNFSFCVFQDRAELRRYFRAVHASLVRDGMFFLELYGGTEAVVALKERRRVGGFTYEWEQEIFDPISCHTVCHINFHFRDGSSLRRAFTYDWRLWSIPEVREMLAEAGFGDSEVWWDTSEKDSDPSRYRRVETQENQDCWLIYVVGLR